MPGRIPATDGDPPVEAVAAFGGHVQRRDGHIQVHIGHRLCRLHGDDDADGAITVMSRWIFTPTRGRHGRDVADADYLHYGFWLNRTTTAGRLTYNEVETFAGAREFRTEPPKTILAVLGTATYKGGSVGVYVKDVLDDQANIDVTSTSGHFSADVELTATFGGEPAVSTITFTIGGKITDFVLQHGEANDWAVGLGLADFSGREVGNGARRILLLPDDPADEYVQRCGYDSTAALVRGMEPSTVPRRLSITDRGATDDISPQPVAVVGEFNANFRDGTCGRWVRRQQASRPRQADRVLPMRP